MTSDESIILGSNAVLYIMVLLSVIVPVMIVLTLGMNDFSVQIIAGLWWLYYSIYVGEQVGPEPPSATFSVQFNPIFLIAIIPLAFLRFVFAYMVYRFYLGQTTLKRALIIGIPAELEGPAYLLLTLLPTYLFVPSFPPIIPIPVPIVLLSGYLLMRIKKPAMDDSWLEKTKPKPVW